ncbi:MAG TPA: hypothetical protein VEH86_03945 [Candidatus Acidoferrum sp.]|nr:hypothetical protein [Candidatus Acidoferrum sp.]
MERKWTFKYSLAAVLIAIAVIAVVMFTNPLSSLMPSETSSTGASFLVMLTDPPTVPAGDNVTVLNLTYTNVSIHATFTNGTSEWLPLNASGTVNLFLLENVSQTIGSTTIPINSTVDKIQFTIGNVEALINGTNYNVTALSNTFVVSVVNSQVNQTLSGVLVDFNPTLVQIQAADADGNLVYYFVLVPSATATVINDVSRDHIKVGSIVELGQNDKTKLVRVVQQFSKNVTIVSASLSVNGNSTSLSVNITNEGNATFRIFGLTLQGEFDSTRIWKHEDMGETMDEWIIERIHSETVPFRVNGTSLTPLLGADRDDFEDTQNSLVLLPGESATLTYTGVIRQPKMDMTEDPAMTVTPIIGDNYTIRIMGEGFQTYNVTATS